MDEREDPPPGSGSADHESETGDPESPWPEAGEAGGALSGISVLDFSRVLAGPLATMVMGDLGATVLKVERPGSGDDTRQWGPPYDERGIATYFQSVNRNKASIPLDMRDEGDLALLRRLAAEADVVVENFRPGVMERFGLDFQSIAPSNRGLVYCSLTGFGAGSGASLPGYDLLVQAMGGLMSITGEPDGSPQKVGVALVDVIAGLFALNGIQAALRHREATGEGQRVEVDLLSSLLAALVNQGSAYTQAGEVARRMGNGHPSIAPYDLYAAADGPIVLAVGNDRQFAQLCEVLGAPELAGDDRFRTNSDRVAARAELRAELEARLAGRGAADWVRDLNAVGVPAGEVNDIAGAFGFAESLGLGPVVEVGSHRLTRNPIRLSATPPTYRRPPPDLPEG